MTYGRLGEKHYINTSNRLHDQKRIDRSNQSLYEKLLGETQKGHKFGLHGKIDGIEDERIVIEIKPPKEKDLFDYS